MKVMYNLTGEKRKELVNAIGNICGEKPKYMGMPSKAYQVGSFEIDKDGAVTAAPGVTEDGFENLLHQLYLKGYQHEAREQDAPDVGVQKTEPVQELEVAPEVEATPEPEHEPNTELEAEPNVEPDAEPEQPLPANETAAFTIELPLEGFTDAKLLNLERLISSKASLIQKSLGAARLTVERLEDRIAFPWFDRALDDLEIKTYSHFISALCEVAKAATRVVGTDKDVPSERFTFRIFLLKLGFKGPEYKAERELLYRPLSGDCAFNSTEKRDAHAEKWKGIRSQQRAEALSNQEAPEPEGEPLPAPDEAPDAQEDVSDALPDIESPESDEPDVESECDE